MGLADSISGYKPEIIEDNNTEFKPLNGKYKAVVKDFGRKVGTSEKTGNAYDFLFIKLEVIETVEGDKGEKRLLDKTFFMSDSEYGTKDDNIKKFLDCVSTILGEDVEPEIEAGYNDEQVISKVVLASEPVLGKVANARCYKNKNGKQTVIIVKEFSSKGKKTTPSATMDDF